MPEKSENIIDIFRVQIRKFPKKTKFKSSKGLDSFTYVYLCFTSKRIIVGFAEENPLGTAKYFIPGGFYISAFKAQKEFSRKHSTIKQMNPYELINDNSNNFEIIYPNISQFELKDAFSIFKLNFSTFEGDFKFNIWMENEFGKKYLLKKHAKPLWDRLVNVINLVAPGKLITKIG